MLWLLFSKSIIYTLKNKIKIGLVVILSKSLIFANDSLLCYKKSPVVFAVDFGAGRAQVLRNPWADSSVGCVNFGQNARFLLHAVCVADFVCATGRGI